MKHYFTKAGGGLVPTGSLEFMFSRKAVFEFPIGEEMDLEELELGLIDAGLEDIEENEGTVYVYGDYTNFGTLSAALETLNIEVEKSSLQRNPTSPVDFTEEQLEDIEKMIDRIEEDDDVQAVFNNLA